MEQQQTLRDLRIAKGWTLEQAALASGFNSRQAWFRIETGLNAPSLTRLQAMADAFGVSIVTMAAAVEESLSLARRRKGNGNEPH